MPGLLEAFLLNVKIFLIAEPIILVFSLLIALTRTLRAPIFLPLRVLATIYVDVFRGVPTILVIFLLGFGVPALRLQGVPNDPGLLGHRRTDPVLQRLRGRGLPGRHRVGASEPADGRPLARPVDAADEPIRRPAPGRAQRRAAAAERLHLPAEGHRARVRARADRGAPAGADRRLIDLQLHAVRRGRPDLHRADDSHDPVRRLGAGRAWRGASGRGAWHDGTAGRHRVSGSRSTSTRSCAASTSRWSSTRRSSSSAPPGRASRPCCAASTGSRPSMRDASCSTATSRSPIPASTSTRCGAGWASCSSRTTSSRT